MGYRGSGARRPKGQRRAGGIVDDLVRQFADPFASVRELVQNGIDAGASAISVHVGRGTDGHPFLTLTDDGSGMTRATIEGPLLTLFSSAKEEDDSKIGKYGVGFISVLALDPVEVQIETWTGAPAENWSLRLFADLSFELRRSPRKREHASGTSLTLLLARSEGVDPLGERVEAALLRWCRHARLPLHFHHGDRPPRRIDRPLDLPTSAVAVHEASDADAIIVSFAEDAHSIPGESPPPRFGFFSRGLTIVETDALPVRAPLGLDRLRFKVDSPRVEHTMSRDGVRHNDAYFELLERVRALGDEPLSSALEAELGRAAKARDKEALAKLYPLAADRLSPESIAVPWVAAIRGRPWGYAHEATVLREGVASARELDTVAHALADADVPVVARFDGALDEGLAAVLGPLVDAQLHFRILRATASLTPLARATEALLRTIPGVAFDGILLAHQLFPLAPPRLALGPPVRGLRDSIAVFALDEKPGWHDRTLLLLGEHPTVVEAERAYRQTPEMTTILLARYLLSEEYGELEPAQSDALLDRSAELIADAVVR